MASVTENRGQAEGFPEIGAAAAGSRNFGLCRCCGAELASKPTRGSGISALFGANPLHSLEFRRFLGLRSRANAGRILR
jgi:hypothetical protein